MSEEISSTGFEEMQYLMDNPLWGEMSWVYIYDTDTNNHLTGRVVAYIIKVMKCLLLLFTAYMLPGYIEYISLLIIHIFSPIFYYASLY